MMGGGGVTEWSLRLTGGNLDLSGVPTNQAADAAGLKTAGGFQSIGATLRRTQHLHPRLLWVTSFSGQWAGKNLDASQEFALGGPQRIRAYPVGEARGDEGILFNMELRYTPVISPRWGALELGAFVDAGRIRIHKDPGPLPFTNACGCNAYALSGAGLSVNWRLGTTTIEINWAHALGDNPGRSGVDGSQGSQALWISGSISF